MGVYYVAVPETGADDKSGCLEFGPPLDLAHISESIWPHYLVRPAPGLMVLFPGYLSHWTVPNKVDEDRIVLAFDVVPSKA